MSAKDRSFLYVTYLGILEPIPQSQALPYLFGLCREYKIFLLSFEKRKFLWENRAKLRAIEEDLGARGIRWVRLTYHKHPAVLSSLFDIFLGFWVCLYLALRWHVKVLHARSNIPVAIGFLIKFFLPVKLFYDRRGVMGGDQVEYSGWKEAGLLHRFSLWFERQVVRKSDALVVLTRKAQEKLKQEVDLSTKVTRVIPCCVDLGRFRPVGRVDLRQKLGLEGKFIFAYSGSLGTYNLLQEMLDFVMVAARFFAGTHLLILTQDADYARGRLQGTPREGVATVISASADELPALLGICDAGIILRRDSPAAFAASPTKFAEYLACGLPVVASANTGDLQEIIRANRIGVAVTAYQEAAYEAAASALRNLLAEREELKQRCRLTAEKYFSLAEGIRGYYEIYRQLSQAK